MKDTMAMLATNWVAGTTISCIFSIGLYLAISIMVIVKNRRKGRDIGALGMIPVVHLLYSPVKGISEFISSLTSEVSNKNKSTS